MKHENEFIEFFCNGCVGLLFIIIVLWLILFLPLLLLGNLVYNIINKWLDEKDGEEVDENENKK